MREVNFSIPNANKASVGITTALYDRRALDCTSTLPLINSLNNLAYLTTSSGRIRDILTVDGGIERLVCILKEGRSKDMMEMWKWNLAFQCIVNIGVRGSEQVRTRVVEADMVPVIATILDNYFQVAEKCRERAELENRRKCPFGSSRGFGRSSARAEAADQRAARARRHVPPPISIPEPSERPEDEDANSEVTPTGPTANLSLSSPPERATFPRQRHHHRSNGTPQFSTPAPASGSRQSQTSTPTPGVSFNSNNANSMFGMRPVRDADRLPSMVSTLNAELSSQPQSPATPHATLARPGSPSRQRRRPSIRHQLSSSGSDDDANMEESQSEDSTGGEGQSEPVVGIQTDIVMEDIVDDESLLEPQRDMNLGAPDVSSTDDDTFNITHRSAADGSTGINTPEQGQIPFPRTHQVPPPVSAVNATPPNLQQPPTWYSSRTLPLERSVPGSILAAMPRDEDVLMSLQLLAYVSKYCNLRSYFQKSHLVPRLKIGNDLRLLDPDYSPTAQPPMTEQELEDEWDNEFVQKPGEKPFNIFPLIEKFTVKPSSSRHATPPTPQQGDMQYWAGVVMRNLCRKDDSRGGIRQCAYWQCGKWEEYTRQFAKCRRCRRTKYCSKECQKGAWGNHRYWCVAADQQEGESILDGDTDFGSPEGTGAAPSPHLHAPPHQPRHRSNTSASRSPTTIFRSNTVRRNSATPSVELPPSAADAATGDRGESPPGNNNNNGNPRFSFDRRQSNLSRVSTVASDSSGIRYRKPERTNTITSYHLPEEPHPHFQPGAEPGIDTSAASDVLPPHLASLQKECKINIFDISLDEVRHTQALNDDLPAVLAEERDMNLPCRWISVNGLSWDVIKALGNKYSLHRLAIEDLLHPSTRTKVDWYADHAFVVLTLQKLVRLHQHRWGEGRCNCPATEDFAVDEKLNREHKSSKGQASWKKWWQQYSQKQSDVLPRYLDRNMDGKIDMFVPAHSGTSEDSPIRDIRTLHRYESAQIPEHTAFMERHSVLASEDLAVSVEQVSIFLTADNTVISFFEHSADDVETPIIDRLTSTETMLRRSCDASLMLQAIVDAIVDLAVPVKDAYNKTRKELQVDAMTNPDIRTSRALHIFGEEIDMLQNLFKPIVHLVNALRDHNAEAVMPPRLGTGPVIHTEHDEKNQPKKQTKRDREGEPLFTRTVSDVQRAAMKPRAAATSVAITPLAHTYFGDVLDHCITIIGALEQMDASASNISTLIFNTVGAKTNNFMMILAVVTVFFAPLTFISGYFGMNFSAGNGLKHPFAFFWIIAIPCLVAFMLLVFATMLWDNIRDLFAKRGIKATRRRRRH